MVERAYRCELRAELRRRRRRMGDRVHEGDGRDTHSARLPELAGNGRCGDGGRGDAHRTLRHWFAW